VAAENLGRLFAGRALANGDPMNVDRRQLLKALGLSALSAPRFGAAQSPQPAPKRIVFFVQPHGHVPSSWVIPIEGSDPQRFAERDLSAIDRTSLSPLLQPLHPFRKKLLAIAGLARTSVFEDLAHVRMVGGDKNNHNIGCSHVLTGSRAAQRAGFPCNGGAQSIDQLLAQRTGGAGRFASRVYGGDYVPNQALAPFSFVGPLQSTPLVKNPSDAYLDLTGVRQSDSDRASRIALARSSMLDAVGEEYRLLASKLSRADGEKLEAHRALVRDLEKSLAMQNGQRCSTPFDPTGAKTRQFMRLIRMAFACDLTRVITYAAPVPACSEFGYPENADVHGSYAHQSVPGAPSCGQMYNPNAERAMSDLSVWYSEHLAYLCAQLEAVPEGSGTMLDNTIIVWQTELATPTHTHSDCFTVLLGGTNFFKTGRYVRYPAMHNNPLFDWPRLGPGHNKLFVSLLNAMGQPDSSFGTASAQAHTGEQISLAGPLLELHR
jgi:Protein of unknown function (DUF1552)